jgi:hypothetical protein
MEWKLMWLKGIENLKGTIPSTDYGTSQDRQCTYNVTLRRVRELLLPWKSNEYYIFVCVCVYIYIYIQGGSNMTGTNCDLFTHK